MQKNHVMKPLFTIVLVALLYQGALTQNNTEKLESELGKSDLGKHYKELFESANGSIHDLRGTGFMPYERLRAFHEQRMNEDGVVDNGRRVEQYLDLLENYAKSRSGNPIAEWESVGPSMLETYGGRAISHAFDPVLADKFWVGSASGGLWLTEDGGENWVPKSDQIPSTGIGAIAIHPSITETMLIGTGEGFSVAGLLIKPGSGIYRSTDGGNSWEPTSFSTNLSAGISIMDLEWHPTRHNEVWAASTNGLYKSENEGRTWSLVWGDGTNHQNFIINEVIIHEDRPDRIFVAIEGKGIYRSDNGGEDFTLLSNGLPVSGLNIISLTQCKRVPDVMYTSIISLSNFSLLGVFKTTDGGDSWVRLPSAPDAPCSPQFQNVCQGWYNNIISVSPTDPEHVVFGGVTLWRSRDGGTSWIQKDRLTCLNCHIPPACKTYVDHHDFGFSPVDTNMLVSISDGGVAISRDRGNCFEETSNGMMTGQFLAIASSRINPSVIIGGLQDHGLQGVNTDNGLEWYKWGYFDGSDVEVHSNNENIFYGTWYDGTYWKVDRRSSVLASQINANMNLNENAGTYFAPLAIHPDNGEVLLGATQAKLYKSTNGGTSWFPKLNASIISDIRFSEADPNYAYAAAWTNVWSFYRSEDAGETWTQTLGAPGWRVTDIKTSATDPLTVFATRNSVNPNTPHVYKSTDGGETWVPIQGDMPDITTNALAVDFGNDDIIYCATDLGVFITENGGSNWTLFNEGMPITYVFDIEFNPADNSLIAGTYGRGVWKSEAYDPEVSSTGELEEGLSLDISPNPATNNIQIRIGSTYSGPAQIRLVNRMGTEVAELYQGNISGDFQERFDIPLNLLGANTYFVQVVIGGMYYTRKLVLME